MPRTHGLPRAKNRARAVVLKLKTSEFKILTRSHTAGSPPASCEELTNITVSLLQRVGLRPSIQFVTVTSSRSFAMRISPFALCTCTRKGFPVRLSRT